jgi:predicted Zn-dependent peptidase
MIPARAPHRLVRRTLDNGLRVLLAPDPQVSVVCVAVHVNVGMRSEPEGRTGFAHLFEHLMFQGSANVPRSHHFRHIESAGGIFNGSTHMDYTQYYLMVPDNALDRGLFLEADRLGAPDLNEENLRRQVDVVKEEIRVNVTNKPYGAFPWLYLPAVLFDTFANSHDGYGSFADLETATVDDARHFFDRYYAPANALLCVCGALDVDETLSLVERYFGAIAQRPGPPSSTVAEPGIAAERRQVRYDRHAPLPAVAVGWGVPDPVKAWTAYLPYALLAKILSTGGASRLERRLVRRDHLVSTQSSYLGLLANAFDVRDPTAFVFQGRQTPGSSIDAILDAVDEELRQITDAGLQPGELQRALVRLVTTLMSDYDVILNRTHALASFELQHGRAELLAELPHLLEQVSEEQIRAAAATLTADRRAVLELRPGTAETVPEEDAA